MDIKGKAMYLNVKKFKLSVNLYNKELKKKLDIKNTKKTEKCLDIK